MGYIARESQKQNTEQDKYYKFYQDFNKKMENNAQKYEDF